MRHRRLTAALLALLTCSAAAHGLAPQGTPSGHLDTINLRGVLRGYAYFSGQESRIQQIRFTDGVNALPGLANVPTQFPEHKDLVNGVQNNVAGFKYVVPPSVLMQGTTSVQLEILDPVTRRWMALDVPRATPYAASPLSGSVSQSTPTGIIGGNFGGSPNTGQRRVQVFLDEDDGLSRIDPHDSFRLLVENGVPSEGIAVGGGGGWAFQIPVSFLYQSRTLHAFGIEHDTQRARKLGTLTFPAVPQPQFQLSLDAGGNLLGSIKTSVAATFDMQVTLDVPPLAQASPTCSAPLPPIVTLASRTGITSGAPISESLSLPSGYHRVFVTITEVAATTPNVSTLVATAPPLEVGTQETTIVFGPANGSRDLPDLFADPERVLPVDELSLFYNLFHCMGSCGLPCLTQSNRNLLWNNAPSCSGYPLHNAWNTLVALCQGGTCSSNAYDALRTLDIGLEIFGPSSKGCDNDQTDRTARAMQTYVGLDPLGSIERWTMDQPWRAFQNLKPCPGTTGACEAADLTLDALAMIPQSSGLPSEGMGTAEPFPTFTAEEHLYFIHSLSQMADIAGAGPVRHYILDISRANLDLRYGARADIELAQALHKISFLCRSRGIAFGIYVWGDIPWEYHNAVDLADNLANNDGAFQILNKAYFENAAEWAVRLRDVWGRPDRLVVQSWYTPIVKFDPPISYFDTSAAWRTTCIPDSLPITEAAASPGTNLENFSHTRLLHRVLDTLFAPSESGKFLVVAPSALTLAPGEAAVVTLQAKNTGHLPWTAKRKYRVGAVAGSSPALAVGQGELPWATSLASGQTGTFTVDVSVPSGTPSGTYPVVLGLYRDGVDGVERGSPIDTFTILVTI